MRLFVSVDLDGLADAVAAAQEPFAGADGLRTTDPEQAHVTLKFLGNTDESRVDELTDALERAVADSGVAPFTVEVGGLGVFPSIEYISVVWVGIEDGTDELTRLHETIEARTTAMGFDPEDHEFTPHATIARMDHAAEKERVQALVRERDPDLGRVRVEEVRLKESTLTPDGPEYATVEAIDL